MSYVVMFSGSCNRFLCSVH